ncbi:P-loop containing nucleoside triphosphatehydrolases superfamily protein, partial [Striga asiatica]
MQHHEKIVEYFNSRGVSAIFLFRKNLLRRMISAEILASYKPTINTTLLIPNLMQVEDMVNKSLQYFNSTRHIILYYEDIIKNRTKLLDVQNFLRVPIQNLNSRQVKIHKGSLSSQVENWGEIENALKGTRYESFLNEDYK